MIKKLKYTQQLSRKFNKKIQQMKIRNITRVYFQNSLNILNQKNVIILSLNIVNVFILTYYYLLGNLGDYLKE